MFSVQKDIIMIMKNMLSALTAAEVRPLELLCRLTIPGCRRRSLRGQEKGDSRRPCLSAWNLHRDRGRKLRNLIKM